MNNNGAFSIKEILSYTLTSETYLRRSEDDDHTDMLSPACDRTQRTMSLSNDVIFSHFPGNNGGSGGHPPTFTTW